MTEQPHMVDDLAEFLDETYAPLINLIIESGFSARVERVRTGEYALTVEGDGTSCDVTAAGRPIPASPEDVTRWQLVCGQAVHVLPGSLPLDEVARRIVGLL